MYALLAYYASLFFLIAGAVVILWVKYRLRILLWLKKGEVIHGFSKQKWEKERHKDDDIGR